MKPTTKEPSTEKIFIIGLDLATNVFQAHGAKADGTVAFRKKLTRNQVSAFFAGQPVYLDFALDSERYPADVILFHHLSTA